MGNVGESSSADDGTRSARPRGLGGDFEFLPLKSPRNPITPIETTRVETLDPGLYKWLREGARRVIGATAKPLYPIDGKAAGIDRRIPPDLPPRGRGTARGGGRSSSPVGARIARPFVPDVITTTLRGDARRVIGATAKPLYPIDGKAAGLDRRNPLNPRQGLKQVHFIFLA